MEAIKKIINAITSIPVVGSYLAFVIGVLPGIPALFIVSNEAVAAILCGLIIAAWCFFLSKTNILKLMSPVIPVPFWMFGLAISGFGVFRLVTGG